VIIVDTSIWIDHLRNGDEQLVYLLSQAQVLMHPMIVGELACGYLQNRQELLVLWSKLPQATIASHEEVMVCIEQNHLMGKGIGYVDVHLLASAMLSQNALIWTRDKRLNQLANKLDLALFPTH